VIEQIIEFSVTAGAPPSNVAPTNFNPIPADGFIEVLGCVDVQSSASNALPVVSVTLGGATPYTPIPGSVLRVNQFGIVGAGPGPQDRVMGRQGVRQGTNLQINLQGGTGQTYTGRLLIRYYSADEASGMAGAVAS
jgi:hypothetical protein